MATGDYVLAKEAQIPNGGLLVEIYEVEVDGGAGVAISTHMQKPRWAIGGWVEDIGAAASSIELVCTQTPGLVTLTISADVDKDAVVIVYGD